MMNAATEIASATNITTTLISFFSVYLIAYATDYTHRPACLVKCIVPPLVVATMTYDTVDILGANGTHVGRICGESRVDVDRHDMVDDLGFAPRQNAALWIILDVLAHDLGYCPCPARTRNAESGITKNETH